MFLAEKTGFEPFETSLTITRDGDHSLEVEVALVPLESPEDEPSEALSEEVPLPDWSLAADAPAPALAPFDSDQARAHQEAWAEYLGQPVEVTQLIADGVELKMALIPPGEFMMGSLELEEGRRDNEGPQHRVRITRPFYLGVYPVTQAQWESVMGNNPSDFSSGGRESDRVSGMLTADFGMSTADFPVEMVRWEEAQKFVGRLNGRFKETGWVYRLPREAEWEYACRAGTTTRYYFGDDEAELGEYAWFQVNSGSRPHPVGQKRPNAWGLYDMHGNVWEFCFDWYSAVYYANSPLEDPTGPASGRGRVYRGGSWRGTAGDCRSAYRAGPAPGRRFYYLGFRLASSSVE